MFYLADKKFRLVRAGLVRAALPDACARLTGNVKPGTAIVAVKNTAKLGRVDAVGYIPGAIVVAGAVRRQKLLDSGCARGWAYVEEGAMDTGPDDAISCAELMGRLRYALDARVLGQIMAQTGICEHPQITKLYPFENACEYAYKGQRYRQSYELDAKSRSITLSGSPVPMNVSTVSQKIKLTATSMEVRESMPRVQTGIRYADAPVKANLQSFTTGGRNSELVTQIIRNVSNITGAINAYLTHGHVVQGLSKGQMTPSFQPVVIKDGGKVMAALAAKGIDPFDFACWVAAQQAKIEKGIKAWRAPGGVPGRLPSAGVARVAV